MKENIKVAITSLYGLANTYDPFVIAELLNIDIYYVDFNKKPLGHCSTILKETVITLDQSLKDSNQRFMVCAHELFHAINHQEYASYYSISKNTKSKMEHEANEFAIELLKMMYSEEFGYAAKSYKELGIYGVSEEMLEYM